MQYSYWLVSATQGEDDLNTTMDDPDDALEYNGITSVEAAFILGYNGHAET